MNISFSQLGKHGRLGNQLFQVQATLGMAEKYGAQAVFPAWDYEPYFDLTPALSPSPQPSPEGEGAEGEGSWMPHGEMQSKRIDEKYFHHYDWDLKGSCDLLGYLQSEKYFGSTRLKLKDDFVEECKQTLRSAQGDNFFDKPTICIQIRRGDYVGNGNYYQLSVNYYIDALLTHFPDWREYNILFISDDIEYCRVHFECMPNAYFPSPQPSPKGRGGDIVDMALASACDHFIISNSSFGWWCAWLGEKGLDTASPTRPPSKIIHCGCLHSGKLSKKGNEDYYPERWIQHTKEDHRIPLRDVTFTMPVFMDHADRKANLETSLHLLQITFDTHFIICEQGTKKFEYTSQWAKYVRSDAPHFHRTKMLNNMCNLAETDYIANWDCDVIIPPMQILMAVEELRAGADMVFPYDGRFARMPRNPWLPLIQKHRDIGFVGKEPFKGREADHNSVGGAVMWNKEAFMDGGMENENMISFGPEDCERHDRFKLLGYDIRRVRGSLFHINHFVGVNSNSRNPHFNANHRELEKVRAMSQDELRRYVDTWAWRHPYTSRYYRRISEGAIRSAKIVMEAISNQLSVNSDQLTVIDIGCGLGEWNNENPYYVGVDHRVRKEDLLIPVENFIECDLEKEFVELGLRTKYDLCLCLEVAEHLRSHRADGLVKMLCSLSDIVLFSAAIPFQGGTGHVNEQWQSYWAKLFEENGFGIYARHQPHIINDPDVELWYRNNIVLYERGAVLGAVRDLILPEYYVEIVGHLKRLKDEGSDQ